MDLYENPECPYCGGNGMHLGTLGRFEYFRCEDCNTEFSINASTQEAV